MRCVGLARTFPSSSIYLVVCRTLPSINVINGQRGFDYFYFHHIKTFHFKEYTFSTHHVLCLLKENTYGAPLDSLND